MKRIDATAGTWGRIDRLLATPDQVVQSGQLLATLDPRSLDRQVERAGAELARTVAADAASAFVRLLSLPRPTR